MSPLQGAWSQLGMSSFLWGWCGVTRFPHKWGMSAQPLFWLTKGNRDVFQLAKSFSYEMLLQTFLFVRLCTTWPLWQLPTCSTMSLEKCSPDFDLNCPARSNFFFFCKDKQSQTRLETLQHRLQSAYNKVSCPYYGCLRSQFVVWQPSSQKAQSIFSLRQQTTKKYYFIQSWIEAFM